ncbi:zinc metalloprotease HtpX [Conexibacter sp. CPCC 206217]|uniref:zinc metalloprotease HtpX n=1 Tax=Conexibacter sp. CPCC 206217 TaxID=3064574 RepID=UPI0027257269|nr:zinc metalloprotease HtpX [Conexibacter sp. CPCC 206217]MDO8209924.1 zinc metalloprotease HtpX [Conexibacter sp. CPCC 206217]
MRSSPSTFGRDTGLQVRMISTIFLLGAVYVVLMAAVVASGIGIGAAVVIAGGLFFVQLFASDKLAMHAMHAKVVSPQEAPQLHALVERLCIQANLPKPKVALAQTSVPNAFAIGRSRKSATVCATTGILELLEPHELEGVMAHELAHVQHRDMMIMTIASFFASIAAFILQWGFLLGGNNRDSPGILPLIAISFAVYAVSFLLLRMLSRYREFAADRGAAVITGRPSALASALMKISGSMSRVPQRDLRAASEMNAFFILPASPRSSIASLFATHPPLDKRIAALARLESQLQSRPPGDLPPARGYRELTRRG